MLCLLLVLAGFSVVNRASAESACAQLGVDCSHHPDSSSGSGSSTQTSDPVAVWKARWAAGAEARRQAKEKRDAQKAIKDAKKKEKENARDEARRQTEEFHQQQLNAQRQREIDAERQRQAEIEAQRRQAAFDAIKPNLLSGLKGTDGNQSGQTGAGNSLGLKGVDDVRSPAARPSWEVQITDPQVAKYAKHLSSVVPPLPIPKEEVALTWKQIYLNDDRLKNTLDLVVAGWEMAGVLGGSIALPCKVILIGGKTFIAGEDGAYMHLVKNEQDYDAALAFLKNPAQSQQFAHLVDDMRQNRSLPASADPAMVKAARAITDPKLGNSGASIAWDSMTSPEALSAMFRKASIEIGSEIISSKAEGLLVDQNKRKVLFDSVRLEREQARHMMALETTTPIQRDQLKTVIDHANQLTSDIYRVEKVVTTADGMAIGDATDKLATYMIGPEAKMPEYK